MYRVVRVNTPEHNTRARALDDMEVIIGEGYYWKKKQRIYIPYGTPLIAMGSHGGQGLFLIGISAGKWEEEADGGEYHHRIPVVWQPVIYERSPIIQVAQMLTGWNVRFGADASQTEFRKVLDWVLKGKAIAPGSWNVKAA